MVRLGFLGQQGLTCVTPAANGMRLLSTMALEQGGWTDGDGGGGEADRWNM